MVGRAAHPLMHKERKMHHFKDGWFFDRYKDDTGEGVVIYKKDIARVDGRTEVVAYIPQQQWEEVVEAVKPKSQPQNDEQPNQPLLHWEDDGGAAEAD